MGLWFDNHSVVPLAVHRSVSPLRCVTIPSSLTPHAPAAAPTNESTFHAWTVGPVFYSAVVLAEAFGTSGKAQIVDLQANDGNVFTPAYAIYENGQLSKVALFNYVTDPSGASTITTSLSFNALQLVVIALVVGIAALKVGPAAEPFLSFNRSVLAVVQKVLWWVILLAPVATVGLLGNAVASYGWDALGSLGTFAVAVYVGLALVLLVVYPVLLRANGLSVRQFFSGAWPAISLGL